MTITVPPPLVVALVIAFVASVLDLLYRRLPNSLTFGSALLALAYALYTHGMSGLLTSAAGWLVGTALLLPFFLLGGMGAGDVKLLAGIGAWLGPEGALWAGLYAMIAGGVMAIVVAAAIGQLRAVGANLYLLLAHWRVSGIKPLPAVTLAAGRSVRLPYALAIAAGTFAFVWLKWA